MREVLVFGAAAWLSLMGCGVATAATFGFTYTGPNSLSGTVTISGDMASPGVFDIVSGTDTVTGGTSLTGLFTIVANPDFPTAIVGSRFDYDDALNPGSPMFLDNDGLLFSNASSFTNIYAVSSGFFSGTSTTPPSSDVAITVSALSAVPEPASMALLGASLVGLAATRRSSLRDEPPGRRAGLL